MALFWCDENTQEERRNRRHIRSRLAFVFLFTSSMLSSLACVFYIYKLDYKGGYFYLYRVFLSRNYLSADNCPASKIWCSSSAKKRVSKNIKFSRGTYNTEKSVKLYHILTSSLINYRTGARQHGIYLLDRNVFVAFYFKIHSARKGHDRRLVIILLNNYWMRFL